MCTLYVASEKDQEIINQQTEKINVIVRGFTDFSSPVILIDEKNYKESNIFFCRMVITGGHGYVICMCV